MKILNFADKTINGSVFTLTDLQLELQDYVVVKTEFIFFNLTNASEYKKLFNIKNALDSYTLIDFKPHKEFVYEERLITSMYVLVNIDYTKLYGDTIFVLDSLDVFISIQNNTFMDYITHLSENFKIVKLLFNTFNIELLNNIILPGNVFLEEYFSKISSKRVAVLSKISKIDERYLVRTKELAQKYENSFLYDNRELFLNTFIFDGFIFSRMQHTENKITIENIGKLFFEFLYLDKKVDYYPNNILMKDGMYYYMKKIGLDGFKTYIDIKIDKDILLKEIFFNNDDLTCLH